MLTLTWKLKFSPWKFELFGFHSIALFVHNDKKFELDTGANSVCWYLHKMFDPPFLDL